MKVTDCNFNIPMVTDRVHSNTELPEEKKISIFFFICEVLISLSLATPCTEQNLIHSLCNYCFRYQVEKVNSQCYSAELVLSDITMTALWLFRGCLPMQYKRLNRRRILVCERKCLFWLLRKYIVKNVDYIILYHHKLVFAWTGNFLADLRNLKLQDCLQPILGSIYH